MTRRYAHFCQDGHQIIGFNDGEYEQCPVCSLLDRLGETDRQWRALKADDEAVAITWLHERDAALAHNAALQQESAALRDVLKAIVVLDDTIDLLAGNNTLAEAARTVIAKAERSRR